jgi:hypothetical protein
MSKHHYINEDGKTVFRGEENPVRYLARQKSIVCELASERRYAEENATVSFQGAFISTDRLSRASLTGAAMCAVQNPAYTVQWKTSAGFITLESDAILDLLDTVQAHVQACFNREAEIITAAMAATNLDELDAIDITSGWPE